MNAGEPICKHCRWSAEVTGYFEQPEIDYHTGDHPVYGKRTALLCFYNPPIAGAAFPRNRPETPPDATCCKFEPAEKE